VILALRALGLGDLLTVVPALRAIRRARPTEPLVLAAPESLRPLVNLAGLADGMVAVESAVRQPPAAFAPPAEPVEVAVNLHGQGPQSTQVLRGVRPEQLWSYGVPGAPAWDPDEHEVRRWCRLVRHHGCPANEADLVLWPRERPGDGVVVHPGAATIERRWPPARFAAVAAALADRGHRVAVTAGPGEESLAREVVAASRRPAVTAATDLDLAALASLVASSALVVSGDTGVAHLATALRTPSVVLFGPSPPSRWGPPPLPRHRVLWHPHGEAAAPGRPDPALLRIGVSEVLAEAAAALAAAGDLCPDR
jgi:ADP-heptose:LPS heptosyltransferase